MNKQLNMEIKNINHVGTFVPICLEDALATLFEYKGIEYKYVFAFAWDFIFAVDWIKTGKLGEAFLVDYFKKKIFFYLKKLYNIDIHPRKFGSVDEYKKYIEKQISEDNPLIVHADSYYLKWSALYQKQHAEHLLLLVGIEDDKYNIIDAIDSEERLELDKEIFHSISKYTFEYDLSQRWEEPSIERWSNKFFKELALRENICPEIGFDNMLEFAEYFAENFDPEIEFEGKYNLDHLFHSVFMNSIRHIIAARNLTIVWLEDEQDGQNEYLNQALEQLKVAAKKWISLQNLLYKAAVIKWKPGYKEKVVKKILEIEKVERNAYILLGKIKNGEGAM